MDIQVFCTGTLLFFFLLFYLFWFFFCSDSSPCKTCAFRRSPSDFSLAPNYLVPRKHDPNNYSLFICGLYKVDINKARLFSQDEFYYFSDEKIKSLDCKVINKHGNCVCHMTECDLKSN